ncbi:uncharacterized protein VTP21DRAFT_341 [Calcarisporiella thermophila]|uniref:uncharacterized protein n=1 Tax=Calcarisporiella thermophila TaxID=911321 RepID=UPI003743B184
MSPSPIAHFQPSPPQNDTPAAREVYPLTFMCASAASSRASSVDLDDDDDEFLSEEEELAHGHQSGSGPGGVDAGAQPLFLNFARDLSPQNGGLVKRRAKGKQPTYKVNGVNILNRNNVDTKTAIERLIRRRENHNVVERRRRDNINNTIWEICELVTPKGRDQKQRPNKGAVLRLAVDYIRDLQRENKLLRSELARPVVGPTHGHSPQLQPHPHPQQHPQHPPHPPMHAFSSPHATGSLSMPSSPRLGPGGPPQTRSTPGSPRFPSMSSLPPTPSSLSAEDIRLASLAPQPLKLRGHPPLPQSRVQLTPASLSISLPGTPASHSPVQSPFSPLQRRQVSHALSASSLPSTPGMPSLPALSPYPPPLHPTPTQLHQR